MKETMALAMGFPLSVMVPVTGTSLIALSGSEPQPIIPSNARGATHRIHVIEPALIEKLIIDRDRLIRNVLGMFSHPGRRPVGGLPRRGRDRMRSEISRNQS